jgi:hypothetical protein
MGDWNHKLSNQPFVLNIRLCPQDRLWNHKLSKTCHGTISMSETSLVLDSDGLLYG